MRPQRSSAATALGHRALQGRPCRRQSRVSGLAPAKGLLGIGRRPVDFGPANDLVGDHRIALRHHVGTLRLHRPRDDDLRMKDERLLKFAAIEGQPIEGGDGVRIYPRNLAQVAHEGRPVPCGRELQFGGGQRQL